MKGDARSEAHAGTEKPVAQVRAALDESEIDGSTRVVRRGRRCGIPGTHYAQREPADVCPDPERAAEMRARKHTDGAIHEERRVWPEPRTTSGGALPRRLRVDGSP